MGDVTPLSDDEVRMLEAVQDYMYIEPHCWNCEVCKTKGNPDSEKGNPDSENEPCKRCISARVPFSRLVAALRDRDKKLAAHRAHWLFPESFDGCEVLAQIDKEFITKKETVRKSFVEYQHQLAIARGEQELPDAH